MDPKEFVGCWQIIEACPCNGPKSDLDALIGLEFNLLENGRVDWTNPIGNCSADQTSKDHPLTDRCPTDHPLTDCNAYEVVVGKKSSGRPETSLHRMRFAAVKGQVISFEVKMSSTDLMQLSLDSWSTLVCLKKGFNEASRHDFSIVDNSFDLSSAIKEGFFDDMVVICANGTEVHSIILGSVLPPKYWNQDNSFFSGMSEEMAQLILHFVYSQCLPETMTMKSAVECIGLVENIPELVNLVTACKTYLRNKPLMNKIMTDVDVIKICCDEAIVAFGGKPVHEPVTSNFREESSHEIFRSPPKVEMAFKKVVKSITIGFLHFVHLSSCVSKSLKEISDDELEIILVFLKSEIQKFLASIHKFLFTLKHAIPALNLTVRLELAEHLLASFESLMQLFSLVCSAMKDVFKATIAEMRPTGHSNAANPAESNQANPRIDGSDPKPDPDQTFESFYDEINDDDRRRNLDSLREILQRKSEYELAHIFHHLAHLHISFGEDSFLILREEFFENGETNRIASFAWTMEQYAYEIPVLLFQLEAFQYLFEKQLDMKSFKFGFTVVSSFVDFYLAKCLAQRRWLLPMLDHICGIADSSELVRVLKSLNLVDSDEIQLDFVENPVIRCQANLPLTSSLFSPSSAENNSIAKKFETLFESDFDKMADHDTDMQLIVQSSESSEEDVIHCHRVILSSRCPWFRRALQAGMKESRERRMTISDANGSTVRKLIRYLYTGRLVSTDEYPLTTDQLIDLLILSDRFEVDSLKDCCQDRLKNCIEEKTVVGLLFIADHYTAGNLRANCIAFILDHPSVTSSDDCDVVSCDADADADVDTDATFDVHRISFADLSSELQTELKDLIRWCKSTPEDFESLFNNFQLI